jgi:hypothetical protein
MQPFKIAYDIVMRDKMIQQIEKEQQKINQVLLDIYSNHKAQKDAHNNINDPQYDEHKDEQHHLSVISDYNSYFEDELRLKKTQLEKILFLLEANDNLEIKDKNLLAEIKTDQSLLLKEIEKIEKEIKSLIKQISK